MGFPTPISYFQIRTWETLYFLAQHPGDCHRKLYIKLWRPADYIKAELCIHLMLFIRGFYDMTNKIIISTVLMTVITVYTNI